jgi:hypothetical protein
MKVHVYVGANGKVHTVTPVATEPVSLDKVTPQRMQHHILFAGAAPSVDGEFSVFELDLDKDVHINADAKAEDIYSKVEAFIERWNELQAIKVVSRLI